MASISAVASGLAAGDDMGGIVNRGPPGREPIGVVHFASRYKSTSHNRRKIF
jgi:hypothetical protein